MLQPPSGSRPQTSKVLHIDNFAVALVLRTLALALLVIAQSLSGSFVVVRADPGEEPDLRVDIKGIKPGSDRDVVIAVTNVSEWWSSETTLTVITTPPTAKSGEPIDVPDLGPKGDKETPSEIQVTYPLDKPCYGYKISVVLTRGQNYMGEEETNGMNNSASMDLCDKGIGPIAGGEAQGPNALRAITNAGVDLSELGKSEWARKGDHTRRIQQSAVQARETFTVDEGVLLVFCIERAPETGTTIATMFFDGNGCNWFYHRQLVVSFDLDWLRAIDRKLLGTATLMADESEIHGGASCLGPLGIAPSNWTTLPTNRIFRTTDDAGVRLGDGPGPLRQWNVVNALQRPINKDYPELTGFVIRSVREHEDVETNFSCSSTITNFRLELGYLVP